MPVCFRHVMLVNRGPSTLAQGRVFVGDSVGNLVLGPDAAVIRPFVPMVLSEVDGVDSCDAVGLTPAEYKSFVSALSTPIEGAQDVNVTADIFIGCLLVLCLIGGWIAGGQR